MNQENNINVVNQVPQQTQNNNSGSKALIIGILVLLCIALSVYVISEKMNTNEDKKETKTEEKAKKEEKKRNEIEGKYDCTGVDSNTDEYLITLEMNNDMTFLYGPYGKLEDNYVKGTYTFKDENKTNNSKEYKYYMVDFEGGKDDFVVDGESQNKEFKAQMEIGITTKNDKREGVIIFVSSYNMYYCYER